ncbi:PAP2-domain-containing protein [Coniophora puteana RWD-64-598 SS2]|uniref:PAP2-domain-containing protein n=1 Tax=Coniophora puteana (strain RWD-64-598) TaxID=741705 RepID=A0A5M3MUF0_CONPW|nr:PAP2-domain-containing protein [Coniophora puteana RWD-64-598 SS2]EIW82802.1 PAP2-domain-containing protein [Coniophora puteana RWD-64-598 SS2]
MAADKKRRLKILRSYAPDWILTIALAVVFFSLNVVHGYRREFSVEDKTISFPFAVHERVPNIALYFIAIVSPIVIQATVNLLTVRSFWDFHNSTLGLILGLVITGAVTQFTKITVGRPRPDLLSRCMPITGTADPTYGLVSDAVCTNTNEKIMIDGWRSFPSGHASLSFAGLGFLSFYLAGKLHLFDTRGHAPKAWIAITPLFGAALVAISRTMDSRHHWQDVTVGSLLGLIVSYFSYRQYFPHLAAPTSHRPHSPRVPHDADDHTDGILPTHVHPAHSRPAAGHAPPQHYRDSSGEQLELLDGTVQKAQPPALRDMWHAGEDRDARGRGGSQDSSVHT